MRLDEPATDLAAAIALVSSLREIPVSPTLVAFGEVGLAGEVRSVDMARARVSEASKFGFTMCIIPKSCAGDADDREINLLPVNGLAQALDVALESG